MMITKRRSGEDGPIGNMVVVKDRFVRDIGAIFEAEGYGLS